MRLIRFGSRGAERPGVLDADGRRLALPDGLPDWTATALAPAHLATVAALLADPRALRPVPAHERWGAPIARPGKVVCIGLNYSDHAAESGQPIPTEPIVFLKAANTVVGPFDDLEMPRGATKLDWEVELGVVIGQTARYVESPEAALRLVAGYCLAHDVSERAFQLERGGQWTKGKSCDTFNPLGPWLSTTDEVPDPQALTMELRVNGTTRQHGSTAKMIFGVAALVHYVSQFMTLEPGDLISTGTPPGVGLGMKPPQYLNVGDVVDLSIDGLGAQRQTVVRG